MLKKNSRLLPNLAKQKPNCTHTYIQHYAAKQLCKLTWPWGVYIPHCTETRQICSEKKYLVPNLSHFLLIHTLKEHLILHFKEWPHQDSWRTSYFFSLTPSSKKVPLELQLPRISKNWSTSHRTVPWIVTLAPRFHSTVNERFLQRSLFGKKTNLIPKITCPSRSPVLIKNKQSLHVPVYCKLQHRSFEILEAHVHKPVWEEHYSPCALPY